MISAAQQRSLKLMADYDCFPLWEQSGSAVGNVDPASLPISPGLAEALGAWAKRYDKTLDRDDPIRSGCPTPEAKVAFKAEGMTLLEQLRMELGENYILAAKL